MKKLLTIFASTVLMIGLYNCKPKNKLSNFYEISDTKKIVYSNNLDIIDRVITDTNLIAKIVQIINNSKEVPIKFISIEKIILKTNNSTISINKNKEALSIKGKTFSISSSEIDTLNSLLSLKDSKEIP